MEYDLLIPENQVNVIYFTDSNDKMTHSSSGDLLCLRLEIDAKRNGKKTVIWEDPDSNKKIEPLKSDGVTGGSYECKDKDCGLDMRLYFRRK